MESRIKLKILFSNVDEVVNHLEKCEPYLADFLLIFGLLKHNFFKKIMWNISYTSVTSGQSYKHFTLVNYNSRVVPDLKLPHITTLES